MTPELPAEPRETVEPVEPPLPIRTRQRQMTERSIRDAALRLFAEHGSAATTVEQIAEAAGISRRTFFRRFDTKESSAVPDLSHVWELTHHHLADVDSLTSARDALITAFNDYYRHQADEEFKHILPCLLLAATDQGIQHALVSEEARLDSALFDLLSPKVPATDHLELRLLITTAIGAHRTVWIHYCETDPEDRALEDVPRLRDKAFSLVRNLLR